MTTTTTEVPDPTPDDPAVRTANTRAVHARQKAREGASRGGRGRGRGVPTGDQTVSSSEPQRGRSPVARPNRGESGV